jgi:hypothetical protein
MVQSSGSGSVGGAKGAGGGPAAARPVVAVASPVVGEHLSINSHRALAKSAAEVTQRVNADPEFSVMLLINPVLALEQYGIAFSPAIRDHILHTLRHPEKLTARRDALDASLRERLSEAPKANDGTWLATLVFGRLKLSPLDIGDAKPAYVPSWGADRLKTLSLQRPKGGVRYPGKRRIGVAASVGVKPPRQAVRRLDLDAPTPKLPHAGAAPAELSLEQLWFYKDQDPLVRDVLEYGILQARSLVFHTPDSFRKIADGTKSNPFRRWIGAVAFRKPPG